jgi:hypothetical protein
MSMKNSMTPSGIEPATFRFVAKYLNHCATISGPQEISCNEQNHRKRMSENVIQFVISGFRSEVADNCALLGHYAASSGNLLQTLRDKLSDPSSGFKNPKDRAHKSSRNVMTQKSAVISRLIIITGVNLYLSFWQCLIVHIRLRGILFQGRKQT